MDADPDPVAEFSKKITKEVNTEKSSELRASVKSVVGFSVEVAKLKRLDRYGLDLFCTAFGRKAFPCRLEFVTTALNEEDVVCQVRQLL